jgi:uroporphyrinogen decarboxylase
MVQEMNKREIVKNVLDHKRAPYVPWHFGFTVEAREKLLNYFGSGDLIEVTDNHFQVLGEEIGYFEEIGNNRFRGVFRVTWDRTIDIDIGNVEGQVLPEPTLSYYVFPDPV